MSPSPRIPPPALDLRFLMRSNTGRLKVWLQHFKRWHVFIRLFMDCIVSVTHSLAVPKGSADGGRRSDEMRSNQSLYSTNRPWMLPATGSSMLSEWPCILRQLPVTFLLNANLNNWSYFCQVKSHRKIAVLFHMMSYKLLLAFLLVFKILAWISSSVRLSRVISFTVCV